MPPAHVLFALLAAAPAPPAGAPTPEQAAFFEAKVRPVLVERCYGCHSADAKKLKGGLRLDTPDGVRHGGESGPVIVPGDPDKSLLMKAIRRSGGAPKMPPDGPLPAAEVAALVAWVKMGAPDPRAAPAAVSPDPVAGRDHWAFRPVGDPAPPTVTDARWPLDPLDRFVLAKLEAKGLTPAAPADKRTLIRRATFDLTGLPPMPEEVDAFLKDDSPAAYSRLIDRLLASSAYGERWGRHWLDVARYADSNGLDENVAHGNAWRYRDWVIATFNADVPYDRFLVEQLAGDLLPADTPAARNAQLIATGFLALGPKVLAEVDEKKMEYDIVDEQLDTVGRTILGLTLGCARCHDHKFDPVTQADYYALAGVFVGTKTMETFTKVARWHENPLGSPAEVKAKADHDAAVAKLKAAIKDLAGKTDDTAKADLKKRQAELAALEKAAPVLPSAMGVTEGKPTDVPLLRRGNPLSPGPVVRRRFPVVLAGAEQPSLPADHSGRLELARWLTRPDHPMTARVMVNRVWRWHFGRGLVGSVDNFGLIGDKPTHPELLDRLTRDFVASGWSVKALHRRIMLSATYRQGSAGPADPENRLFGLVPARRLDAEAIRDALLAVSGLLDRTPGGPALTHVKNREYLFDHTSKDGTSYASNRRSVYLPVVRNNLYDVFQLFDATDATVPSGDRPTTTVPTQALFFLNADLTAKAAAGLADRVLAPPQADDAGRVGRLFALAYGRPPTAAETARLVAAVADFETEFLAAGPTPDARRRAWAAVCRAVLASNEFVSVN